MRPGKIQTFMSMFGIIFVALLFVAIISSMLSPNVGSFFTQLLNGGANGGDIELTLPLASLQDFLTLTLGIIVGALPFVILGTLIATAIQYFISPQTLIKLLPKNALGRRISLSFMGIAMPVCECGNVPIARTLIARGVDPYEAIIFLLAAPSINIVTFIVTWEAFSFNESMAVLRVVATFIVANLTAVIVAKIVAKDKLLTPAFEQVCRESSHTHRSISKASHFFRTEAWLITRMLVMGAMIAAATQTFVPQEVLATIGSNIFLSVLAMLFLAFVISICSSVDAFFALAYVNTFSFGSILAFLVAGPMVDIKMLALMKTTFTYRGLAAIAGSVFVLTFIIGIGVSYVWQ